VAVDIEVDLSKWMRGELRSFVIEMGLRAMTQMLEHERAALCGPRYAHGQGEQKPRRGGGAPSRVVLGGRKCK